MTNIDYEVTGDVAHVRLNRPEKHNALTLDMIDDLAKAADRAAKDRSIRAVVLNGAGESFCSGLDFASAGKERGRIMRNLIPKRHTAANAFQAAGWAWRSVPVPVIAVVTGHCYGGGLQIALGADFRFATPSADLSIMESRWGLIPDMSLSASIAQLASIDVAKRLTMTGETFTAAQALEWGLLSGVAEDPHAAADELIAAIRERSPDAVAAAKALFEQTWYNGSRLSFPVEQTLQIRLLRGRNHAIARKAGLAKEQPQFTERQY
ncbi:crotonase/enoyl-CoA hydratase family protein [Mycolicibacterium brumae]|uniref:Enoyl-CoA hydratase n=1 Tax=Mycolicibacterium brumae TaxID=85968 RepID=A0A2G5PB14_9MYCO|nr:crotonase/enoyl-CoA hydratase family protein [Mycolicibacterium brumae]MCV7192986.1 crotonase/enoyl-CoA hydratase family protein [Mycolicibacterium brumae]PIB75183.1 enoyl-CoA hydratase [Mycolicibacterium brumae]RWA23576.1 enoyl-CoA hydratase [Mycolicibacterium brumae DSM 44177]UWW08495.1 crotonase/enoyl-CoA hydratase family protein [Mycolicibacterium brumae]